MPAAITPPAPAPPSRVRVALLGAANRQCAALLEVFREDVWFALLSAPLTGDKGTDDAATTCALLNLDASWAPIWSAWRSLRMAESGDEAGEGWTDDEQPLAVASRALTNAQPPSVFARVREILLRGGELGPRAETLRDIDSEIALIVNARDLARVGRVKNVTPLAP